MLDYHDYHAYEKLKHEHILGKMDEYRQEGLRKLSIVLAQSKVNLNMETLTEDWLDEQDYAKEIFNKADLDQMEISAFFNDQPEFESLWEEWNDYLKEQGNGDGYE